MGVTYEVYCSDSIRWHDILTKFHEDWFGQSSNINTSTICGAAVVILLVLLAKNLCCIPSRWTQMPWWLVQQSRQYLGHYFNHFRGYPVGITHDRDLWCMPLRWPQVARYRHTKFHEDWYRRSSSIKVLSQKFERLWYWYYWWQGFMNYVLRWDHVSGYTYEVSQSLVQAFESC
jgi:hypothetical protein